MPDPATASPPDQPPAAPAPSVRRELAPAFAVGLLAALVVTARVWGAPTRRLLGDWQEPDTLGYQWICAELGRRLLAFESPFSVDSVYAPVGASSLGALGGAEPLVSAPFVALLGWPLGVNFYTALVLAANVGAGAFLARVVGSGPAASIFGGLALGLSPYVLGELSGGRLGQVPVWAITGALALWIQQLDAPDRRRGGAFALLFGFACFEYAWYGVMGAVAAAALLAARVGAESSRLRDRTWLRGIGASVGGAVLASVPAAGLLALARPSAALLQRPHPLAIEYSLPPAWPLGTAGGPQIAASVSIVLVVLAAVGLVWNPGERRWLGRGLSSVVVLGWMLSLGPRLLTPGGPIVDSHFPFHVFYSALFPTFYYPYQHLILVSLGLSALAARGACWLAGFLPASGSVVLVSVLAVLVGGELTVREVGLFPAVSHTAPEPKWVADLRALPEGAFLQLPLTPELRVSQEGLFLQTMHGHPLVDGRTMWRDDQRPLAWDEYVAASGFLAELQRFERGREVKGDASRANYFRYPKANVAELVASGVRWVVVWEALYPEALRGLAKAEHTLLEQLCGRPAYAAEGIMVYDLAAHRGSGEVIAPLWRMPDTLRTGDGVRRMAGRVPPGVLFERGR